MDEAANGAVFIDAQSAFNQNPRNGILIIAGHWYARQRHSRLAIMSEQTVTSRSNSAKDVNRRSQSNLAIYIVYVIFLIDLKDLIT